MEELEFALQEYVLTANDPKYNGDYSVINSKFPELADIDPFVLQEYVLTANDPKHGGDWDVINSKFPEFKTLIEENEKKEKRRKTNKKLNNFLKIAKKIGDDEEILTSDWILDKFVKTPDKLDKRLAKTISGWFGKNKTALDLAIEKADFEPFSEEETLTTSLEISLFNSGANKTIEKLEDELKEPSLNFQQKSDIVKKIDDIKSAHLESLKNPIHPNIKSYNNKKDVLQDYNNDVMRITERVINTGGDQKKLNDYLKFWEKYNPDKVAIDIAKYEIKTIEDALTNIKTFREGDDYSSYDMGEDETTELNELVEQELIKTFSIKDMGRIAANNYTIGDLNVLESKEKIIYDAKTKVLNSEYEKANKILDSAVVLDFTNKENNLIDKIEQMISGVERDDNNNLLFTSQQDLDNYNSLIKQYENLSTERENVNEIVGSARSRLIDLSAEIGYDAITNTFKNQFKATDEYRAWIDNHVDGSTRGVVGDAVGTFIQEGINLIADATMGAGVWIAGLMDNKFNEDDPYYSGHDVVKDWYKNYANYNYMGVSDKNADILDENGNFRLFKEGTDDDARIVSKTVAEMLPFTIGVIISSLKGNPKPAKNMWSTVSPKFLTSEKGRRNLRMMDATWRMTVNDNFHEGKDMGLDDSKAYAYSHWMSFATGVVQGVMPDVNFLGSPIGKNIIKSTVNNLRLATTRKGISTVLTQGSKRIAYEVGEEELELFLGDVVKYSVGYAHSPDILDVKQQKELIAATLMLSGTLTPVGAVKDFKNVKNQVYKQYKSNGQEILKLLDDNLVVAQGKLKRARTQKSKDRHQATIDQINNARNYGQSIVNAINSAPENVSDEQIDLLIQKQNLIKQKQNKDKAAVAGIDEEIKVLDEKISESAIRQREVKETEKIKTTITTAIEKGGLEGEVIEMTSKEISNIKEEGFDSKAAANQFGFIRQNTDGSFKIFLNKDKPMVGTAAHEFVHAVLFKTIGGNKDLQNNLGDALVDHVSKLGGDKSILGKRLSAYGKYDGNTFIRDDLAKII